MAKPNGLRQQVRQLTREAEPTAGAINSQSLRTGSGGWLSKYRRVASRDYEANPRVGKAIIKACFCHLMLRRLANGPLLKHSN